MRPSGASDYNDGSMTPPVQLVALSVGNTTVHAARFLGPEMGERFAAPAASLAPLLERVGGWWSETDRAAPRAIALASVNDAAADRLASAINDQLGVETYRVGSDLPVPVTTCLDPETLTGVDRLLAAAAAWDATKQACIVVDAGTAVTVDFVDGEGTFHGGAIAPGLALQLRALHEGTAALPELAPGAPAPTEPFGRNTAEAMRLGTWGGIRGMVRFLAERYADAYGAYPTILATGGDAETLFEGDEMIDRVVPDLVLRGIEVAARQALAVSDG